MVAESNATYLVIGAGLAQLETMGMLVGNKIIHGAINFNRRQQFFRKSINKILEYRQII